MMEFCGHLKTVEFQCAVVQLDSETLVGEVRRIRGPIIASVMVQFVAYFTLVGTVGTAWDDKWDG